MKQFLSAVIFCVLSFAGLEVAVAIPVDLTSGTSGTTHPSQSFNETRGVTATVLSGSDLDLVSMTLAELDIANGGGAAGARVYSDSGALLASADVAVPIGSGQTVTIPILANLVSGNAYRFAFFVNDSNGGSGTMFDPDPSNSASFSPYVDSSGLLQISAAWDTLGDAFPATINSFIPFMSLDVRGAPEPATLTLLGVACAIAGFAKRRKLN